MKPTTLGSSSSFVGLLLIQPAVGDAHLCRGCASLPLKPLGAGQPCRRRGGRRRVSLVGVPQRADHAVDLRRSQRVSASIASDPDTQKAKTKSPFLSTLLFFSALCDGCELSTRSETWALFSFAVHLLLFCLLLIKDTELRICKCWHVDR